MKKQTKKMSNTEKGVLVGVGIATLAAAAAGTYFLYGSKKAGKNRKQVKSWMLRARGEVLEKIEALQNINESAYHKIVKEVASRYKTLNKIDSAEINDFVAELKTHWANIKKEINAISLAGKKNVSKSADKSKSSNI